MNTCGSDGSSRSTCRSTANHSSEKRAWAVRRQCLDPSCKPCTTRRVKRNLQGRMLCQIWTWRPQLEDHISNSRCPFVVYGFCAQIAVTKQGPQIRHHFWRSGAIAFGSRYTRAVFLELCGRPAKARRQTWVCVHLMLLELTARASDLLRNMVSKLS